LTSGTTPGTTTAAPRARIGAVDAIKGIAIISVLLLHSLPRQFLYDSLAVFHIWQAVPVLVVMMGYTGAFTRVRPLRDYLRRRAARLLVPWAIAWLVALLVVLLRSGEVWKPELLLGALPVPGPGNYFIAIAFEFIFVLPLLRKLLEKGPWVLLATCFAVDLAFQLVTGYFAWDTYLYKATVLRYLFAAGLGLVMASGGIVWPLFPISFAYLVAMAQGVVVPYLGVPSWQPQSLFAAGYTTTLVGLGLRGKYPRLLESIGRASWHIFLVQIIWFGALDSAIAHRFPLPTTASVLLSVIVCLAAGLAFANVEGRATGAVLERWTARRAPQA